MTPEDYRLLLERLDVMSAAIARLSHRIDALERGEVRPYVAPPPRVSTPPPPPPPPPEPVFAEPSIPEPAPEPQPPELQPASREIESAVGLKWLNRIGVVTLVLGVAFLFKYAVDNEWIGPSGRVAIGIFAGLAALGGADALWRRAQQVFAQGITGLGIALLYLSFYAAHGFYHLAPIELSFAAMALTTVLGGLLAIRYNSVAVSLLALAGGYLTPVVLSSGQNRPWTLFIYLLLVNAGAAWAGRRQGWRLPSYAAFLGGAVLYLAWYADKFDSTQRAPSTFFVLGNYLVFLLCGSRILSCAAQLWSAVCLAATWEKAPGGYFALGLPHAGAGLAASAWLRWPSLAASAFAGFWLAFAGVLDEAGRTFDFGLFFAAATAGFVLFHLWALWRLRWAGDAPSAPHLMVLALNSAFYFATGYHLLRRDLESLSGLFAVAVAAVFAGTGWLLWNSAAEEREKARPAALLTAVVAITFLTLAIPVQFSAWRITLAWVIEAVVLAFIARKLPAPRLNWLVCAVLILVAGRLLYLDSLILRDPSSYALIFNPRFFVMAWSAAGFLLCAWLMPRELPAAFSYLAGHLTLVAALQLEADGYMWRTFDLNSAGSYSAVAFSVLVAAYGLALVALGVMRRSRFDRLLGLAGLCLVVAKLYAYDVWVLGRLFRTTAFVALGVLLVSASYLYSRYRARISELLK